MAGTSSAARAQERRNMRMHRLLPVIAVLWLGAAGPAQAGDFYFSGQLGLSSGEGESGGATPFFSNTGSDRDSSPLFGGTLGFGFAPQELLPEETWVPRTGIRVELEGLAGRDYEFLTAGADPYYTEVTSWSLMNNLWVDVPLNKPIAWAFGRIPVLEPLSVHVGAGIGIAFTDATTTDNVSAGSDDGIGFTYQVGAGLGYAITEFVSLTLGYRYLDLGQLELPLFAPQPFGSYTLDLASHEITSSLRVTFRRIELPAWRRD
jgi:opacity protein-like surface antigen